MLSAILFYILLGMLAGFLAGLLGVGGGMVIVPSLFFIFSFIGFPEGRILHLALGTSLACILFTSISSFRAHHLHGSVNWKIFRQITPGILIGTFGGAMIAAHLNSWILKLLFATFLIYAGMQMLFEFRAEAIGNLPGKLGMSVIGCLIGAISSLIGIGGGTLSVPFMLWCKIKIHEAIGTSAAIGFPIAVAGTVGYYANGLNVTDLPPYCLGYIHYPAVLGIVPASVITAPLGVKLSHRIPVGRLKKIFGMLLLTLALRMGLSLF